MKPLSKQQRACLVIASGRDGGALYDVGGSLAYRVPGRRDQPVKFFGWQAVRHLIKRGLLIRLEHGDAGHRLMTTPAGDAELSRPPSRARPRLTSWEREALR